MDLINLFSDGKYSSIVDQWESAQSQLATDPNAAYIVAASHFRLENFEEARKICEGIEGVFSENHNFLSMYAAILRRLSLYQRSEEKFVAALQIAPEANDLKNNYSNLLIDQTRFDDAKKLLEEVLEDDPNYQDAKLNLARVNDLIDEQKNKAKNIPEINKQLFEDPLDEAFATNEVSKCGSKLGSVSAAVENLLPTPSQGELEQADLELLQLAEKQIKTKQYHGALDILNKIRKRQKSNSTLYRVASDSLIGLERFGKAEILALCAYINGDKSIANFLNLASLSAMRKDQLMASHWLNEAKKIDENNKHFLQSKELLFPHGSAREDDMPFSG